MHSGDFATNYHESCGLEKPAVEGRARDGYQHRIGSGVITFQNLCLPEQRDDAVERDIFHLVEQDQAAVVFGQDLRTQQIGAEPEILLLQIDIAAILQENGEGRRR